MLRGLPLVYLLGLTAPAKAQEAAPPPAPPLEPGPLAERYAWQRAPALPTTSPLSSLAVRPADPSTWLVADTRGAVFRSTDRGRSWSTMLTAPRPATLEEVDEERVLLDVESRLGEEVDPERAEPAAGTTGEGAELDVAGATDLAAQDARRARSTLRADPEVWLDPLESGVALLGRDDGLWRSGDGGLTWTRLRGEPPASAFARFDELILAGGPGLRASLDDGETWIGVVGAADDAFVHDFARVEDVYYAGTAEGLFQSTDGLRWRRVVPAGVEPVLAVVADPDWPGGLWLAGPSGLRRSDDRGASFFTAGRQPLASLRRMVHAGRPGHLVAASTVDGVWESADGGLRWRPLTRFLTEPDVRGLVMVDGRPVIATRGGVWWMVLPEGLVEAPSAVEHRLSLGDAVDLALRRGGLDETALVSTRRAAIRPLLPTLNLTADWWHARLRDSDFQLVETIEGEDGGWRLRADLCFGSCGGGTLTDLSLVPDDPALLDYADRLVVIDDEVYGDDAVVAAAANLSERLVRYRVGLAEQVADAWLARQKAAGERGLMATQPLRERVLHDLAIQELDARLDLWTEGAWLRSIPRTEEVR